MSISRIGSIPVTIHQPPAKVDQVENEETQSADDDKVTISPESWQRLKESNDADESQELPAHIRQMIEAIKQLNEHIKAAKEALEKAKQADYADEETKRATIDGQQSRLNSLELSRLDAIRSLQDAMKEAGITDFSIIAKLMRD